MERLQWHIERRQTGPAGSTTVALTVRMLESTLPMATSNELPVILNALAHSALADPGRQTCGFPYAFPLVFGE